MNAFLYFFMRDVYINYSHIRNQYRNGMLIVVTR